MDGALAPLASQPVDVRAEMVANVWQIVAETGQVVAPGDEIVILESMKMEIPITAPEDGVVAELLAAEGDTVTEGTVIARLEA